MNLENYSKNIELFDKKLSDFLNENAKAESPEDTLIVMGALTSRLSKCLTLARKHATTQQGVADYLNNLRETKQIGDDLWTYAENNYNKITSGKKEN